MKVFLFITDATFDSSLAFLRDLKAKGQVASVFSSSLKKEGNRKKIADLGFTLLDEERPYAKLAEESGRSALVTSFEKPLPEDGEGIFCSGLSAYDLEDICLPIGNIPQRVNVANLLENNLTGKLGGLLAIGYIVAPQEFWTFMNGVYQKWLDELYVSPSPVVHDLLFNFCVAFLDKADSIGVRKND